MAAAVPSPNRPINITDLLRLNPRVLDRVIDRMSASAVEELMWDWEFRARPEQLPPDGSWKTWVALAGRGWGKTRCGAEWVRKHVKLGKKRIHLIAPTAADARDVMVEGQSGLLSVCWQYDRDYDGRIMGRPKYEPSKRRLTWQNGARATLFSSDVPNRLRGPQCDLLWGDELAVWNYARECWDMAMFGLRLGVNPQALITTTPKPISVLRDILKDASTVITGGSMYDNRANLADSFVEKIRRQYEGTRLGRQEIHAELLTESEEALWSLDMIEKTRIREKPIGLVRVVVGVDPAISSTKESNETGIIVAGKDRMDHGYVLADSSGRLKPNQWGKRVVEAFYEYDADCVVAEGNQGGDMVKHTIHTIDRSIPVKIVFASRGKQARAEPISSLYQQGRVHHVGAFPQLEDQMVTWEPESGAESPDRLDGNVWALTDLLIKERPRQIIPVGPTLFSRE